jgi:hypothetical protein
MKHTRLFIQVMMLFRPHKCINDQFMSLWAESTQRHKLGFSLWAESCAVCVFFSSRIHFEKKNQFGDESIWEEESVWGWINLGCFLLSFLFLRMKIWLQSACCAFFWKKTFRFFRGKLKIYFPNFTEKENGIMKKILANSLTQQEWFYLYFIQSKRMVLQIYFY